MEYCSKEDSMRMDGGETMPGAHDEEKPLGQVLPTNLKGLEGGHPFLEKTQDLEGVSSSHE